MSAVTVRFARSADAPAIHGFIVGLAIHVGHPEKVEVTPEPLARQLESEHASGEGAALTREDYVAKGLVEYERSWERKLLWGVFILPVLAMLGIALVANYG